MMMKRIYVAVLWEAAESFLRRWDDLTFTSYETPVLWVCDMTALLLWAYGAIAILYQ